MLRLFEPPYFICEWNTYDRPDYFKVSGSFRCIGRTIEEATDDAKRYAEATCAIRYNIEISVRKATLRERWAPAITFRRARKMKGQKA